MLKRKLTIWLALLLSICTGGYAQNNNAVGASVASSPNAAAVGRYGDAPVNLHTGTSSVGLPIYTLSHNGGLSAAVSLSYHAGGVRVADIATPVGLGWSLAAGGSITRTVRNAPDEGVRSANGSGKGWYLTPITEIQQGFNLNTAHSNDHQNAMSNGMWDTEPDVFQYDLPGYSGKFYFKHDGTAPPIPVFLNKTQDIKIETHFIGDGSTRAGTFDYWVITTPDGTRYYFGTPRTNDDDIFTDVATELTCSYSASTGAELKNVYVSAWNLTKIETPDRNHNIQFKYERETYRYTNRGSDHVAGQTYVTDVDREINSEVLGSRLAEIISDFEKITFIRGSNNRRDLDQWVHVGMSLVLPNTTQNMAKPLSKIVVQSTVDNQTIRTFNLNQGYLESSAVGYPNDNATNNLTHSDKYRLYLKSVDEYGNTMSEETKRTHTYSYIGVGTTLTSDGTVLVALPRRKSAASDIWGFYNGKDANKYLNAIVDLYSGNIADYGTANRIDQNVSFGDIGIEMTKQFNTSLGTFFNNNPSYWIEQYQNLVYNGNPAYVNNAFNNPLKVFAYLNSDRTPSAQHMSIGALNKVTYPMGSVTEYEFEPHTYLGKTAKFKFVRPMYQFISGGDAGNTRYNEGIIYSHPPLYFPRPNNPDVDDIPIRIKNAHIEVVNPELFNTNVNSIPGILNASRLVYSLSLENKNDNYQTVGMEFRVRIKKGSVIKEKIYLLQPGEQKKVFLEKFIGNIWDGTLEEFQNAEIQIFGNNHGSNKCMISFLVFYNTVGIETEDKLMGGLRIKSIKTKESENATPIVANYNYKQELQQYTSGIMPVMPRLIYNMRYAAHGPENFYVTMVQNANSPTNPVLSIYNEAIRFDIKPGNLFGASSNNQSGGIGYKEVKVSKPGQGFTRYYYHMDQPEENKPIPYPEVPEYSISGKNGLLMRSVSYNEVGARVHEINYNYTEERPAPPYYGTNFIEGYNFTKPMHQRITKYRIDLGYRVYLSSKTEWIDGIESTVRYRYDPLWRHHLPIETTMRNSDEKTYKTKTTYAGNDDFVDWQWFNKHMLHLPLKTEVYVNNELLAEAEPIFSGDEIAGLKRIVSSRSKLHKGTNPQWITAGTIEYNANGLPKKVTERAATVSTEFVWDAQRRLSSVTHAGQFSTNYHYLQNTTQVKEVTNYLGQKVKYYYDDFGQVNKTEGAFTPGTDDANVRQEYSYKFKSPTTPDHYTETSMWTSDLSEIVGSTGNTVVKTRQYLDGFGRVKGAIQEGYTPDQKNLSSAVTYDALGRLDKVFEPFERTTGGYAPAPVATPFVTAEYEASPLGRTLKRVNPDQTTVQVAHGSNTAADAIAQYALDQATGTVTVVGTYPASTLYKVVSTDENGKKSAAFTDKIGRTIMTRRYGANNETLDTYVAYDKYGNAVAVIPPFDAGEQVNKLSYFYEYDNRNRLTRKKIPNTDWVNFHYDNRDFLVMTQDGNMRAENPNKYVYAQYDELGRPVAAGFVIATNPNDETANRNRAISPDDLLSTVTYRADANLVEKTATRILGATGGNNVEWITTAYTYDTYWRLVSTNSNNHLEHDTHAEVTNMAPKFHGLPDATSRTHKGYKNVDINHHFAFDHSGRLLNVQHEAVIDGESMGWQNLSALQYNYKDQVTVKHLSFHNSTGKWLQDIDYQYNVRGWLTAINPFDVSAQQVNACNQLLMSSNDEEPTCTPTDIVTNAGQVQANEDLFHQEIRYANPTQFQGLAVTPQYGGNISQTVWQVKGRERQAYNYQYDSYDRMTNATYFDIHDNGTFSLDNKYGESVTYDKRGNIKTLTRRGMIAATVTPTNVVAGIFGVIDQLTYHYNGDKPNQLAVVSEAANADKGYKKANNLGYVYDANGNLTKDPQKKIALIEYNFLNLPVRIDWEDGKFIEFLYDAGGTKLRKTVSGDGEFKVRDYCGGIEYQDGKLDLIHHAEGGITPNDKAEGKLAYFFTLRDHLGNTRVTFMDKENDGKVDEKTDITQINHYYPFGMNMEGNWNGAEGALKYQFTGQEWNDDFGLGWSHHQWRFYDPALGRWHAVDPLAEATIAETPYHYVSNNPVNAIDPSGLSSERPLMRIDLKKFLNKDGKMGSGSAGSSSTSSSESSSSSSSGGNSENKATGPDTRPANGDEIANGLSNSMWDRRESGNKVSGGEAGSSGGGSMQSVGAGRGEEIKAKYKTLMHAMGGDYVENLLIVITDPSRSKTLNTANDNARGHKWTVVAAPTLKKAVSLVKSKGIEFAGNILLESHGGVNYATTQTAINASALGTSYIYAKDVSSNAELRTLLQMTKFQFILSACDVGFTPDAGKAMAIELSKLNPSAVIHVSGDWVPTIQEVNSYDQTSKEVIKLPLLLAYANRTRPWYIVQYLKVFPNAKSVEINKTGAVKGY